MIDKIIDRGRNARPEPVTTEVVSRMEEGDVRTTSWDFDHRADGTIDKGPIWMYLDDQDRVFQCPDFRGNSNFGDDPATGYNYNTTFVGAEGRFPTLDADGRLLDGWNHCRRGVPAAAHRRPSTTPATTNATTSTTKPCYSLSSGMALV